MNMPEQQRATQKTPQEVIRLERDLAKYANLMDSLIRIPFTKQGVGADAALGIIPVAGDVAGFALTCYAVYKAKQIGVPQHKLNVVYKLAVMDLVVGFIPIAGTLFDIFIRPSRKALDVVHEHIRDEYQIRDTTHVVHPYLHEKLEQKQQHSAFWRQPVIAWLWLHIPDLIGLVVIVLLLVASWYGFTAVWSWYQNWS